MYLFSVEDAGVILLSLEWTLYFSLLWCGSQFQHIVTKALGWWFYACGSNSTSLELLSCLISRYLIIKIVRDFFCWFLHCARLSIHDFPYYLFVRIRCISISYIGTYIHSIWFFFDNISLIGNRTVPNFGKTIRYWFCNIDFPNDKYWRTLCDLFGANWC